MFAYVKNHFDVIALIFCGLSIGLMAPEIYLVHSITDFSFKSQYWPLFYSMIAGPLIIIITLGKKSMLPELWRFFLELIFWLGALLGIIGLIYHAEIVVSKPSMQTLVYSAPVLAPLAYTGIPLFGIAIIELSFDHGKKYATMRPNVLLFITAMGFAFNVITASLDHAQNGFHSVFEWVPVIISTVAASWFFLLSFNRTISSLEKDLSIGIIIVQFIVAGLGMLLHGLSVQGSWKMDALNSIIYEAPILAPAVLAIVALFGLLATFDPQTEARQTS